MGRRLSFLERALIFIASFFVVVFFLVRAKIWEHDLFRYLLQAEKWPELIFVLIVAYGLKMLFTELLQWAFRYESRRR